ncbi:MAG: ATP-binding protein [Myxococcales bacterium]|nr:ATP-binding protein [Myxococcales bacterium]
MNSITSQFDVDLAGLIDVLGGHLYSSPDVFVRELLQNAVDACTQRHRGNAKGHVTVRHFADRREIEFEDDGIGMDEETIRSSLARIGASTKRGTETRDELLGRFGIGLLAGFMVAEELIVETKMHRGAALRWVGRRDGTWSMMPGSRTTTGTTVTVPLDGRGEPYASPDSTLDLVTKFGRYLPVEVSFVAGGDPVRVSRERAWLSDCAADWWSWVDDDDVLAIVPVSSGKTRGFVWLGGDIDEDNAPTVKTFVKGMPVSENVVGLLPKWAHFCGAVIDSADLLPTASREDLVRNDAFTSVAETIERSILGWLMAHGKRGDREFVSLLEESPLLIKSACAKFAPLRKAVGSLLPFQTTAGVASWEEIAKHAKNGIVLGVESVRDFENARALTASRGLLVVNHGYLHDTELLHALASDQDLRVEPLTPAHLAKLIQPAPDEARRFESVLATACAALESEGVEVSVGRFTPVDLPAMLLTSSSALEDRARRLADSSDGFGRGFLAGFTERKATVSLVLNLDNALIQALPKVVSSSSVVRVVRLLNAHAALTLRRTLSVNEVRMLSRDLLGLLETTMIPGMTN